MISDENSQPLSIRTPSIWQRRIADSLFRTSMVFFAVGSVLNLFAPVIRLRFEFHGGQIPTPAFANMILMSGTACMLLWLFVGSVGRAR